MVRRLQDAEDVFQQASMTMWRKFDEFQPGTDFVAWACRVARFKALNFLDAKGRQRVYFSEGLLEELARHEPSTAELQETRLKALAQCREKLSPIDQQLLVECYSSEEAAGEVARRLGRPVGSVYDSLSRIRRALYRCIRRTLASEGYV
jgi:RNA polymerase sigma-70 factor (ECF subfamily)